MGNLTTASPDLPRKLGLLALVSTRTDSRYRMRLIDVWPEFQGAAGAALDVEFPMVNFMTATERGGSPPADRIDVMGIAAGRPNTIRYALIHMGEKSNYPSPSNSSPPNTRRPARAV